MQMQIRSYIFIKKIKIFFQNLHFDGLHADHVQPYFFLSFFTQGAAGIQQFCKGFVKEAFDMVKQRGGVGIHDEVNI